MLEENILPIYQLRGLTGIADPNAPKRGLSAYMFFANDNREKVREENPGISFGKDSRIQCHSPCEALVWLTSRVGQVGKTLGERWKNLSDSDRRPYDERAAADKKRYEEEKAAYNVCDRKRTPPPSRPPLLDRRTNQC